MNINNKLNGVFKSCLLLCALLVLGGCTTVGKANKLQEKGQYVESVKIITDKLDQSGTLPSQSTFNSMSNIIYRSIQHFENKLSMASEKNYDERINAYEGIFNIRVLLENKFYSNHFANFIASYKLPELRSTLAQLHYLKGNEINPVQIIDYKIKSDIYKAGLKYAEYKDMRTLMEKYAKQYATLAAEDGYKKGVDAAKMKDYFQASEHFAQVINVYKAYGDYKDSKKLFTQYDRQWRTESAQKAFDEAQSIAQNARYKADNREAAQKYTEAFEYYKPYGDFKNASSFASKQKDLGTVYIDFYIDGHKRDGTKTERDLKSIINPAFKQTFNSSYYQQATRNTRKDLTIRVRYSVKYHINKDKVREYKQQETGSDGKVRYFTKVVKEKRNRYEIDVTVTAAGKVSYQDGFKLHSTSSEEQIRYTGDVPSGYKAHTNGRMESEYTLERQIENEVQSRIKDILLNIRDHTDYI
ncbi:hypothetical protein [Neisseria sp. Ec49-e6-T10]|uniref:hypothetical protein n=1 Tax=Neisseria sp. Ec49-e6-T10 TaxID=3140744 RepID=UPI003EC089D5